MLTLVIYMCVHVRVCACVRVCVCVCYVVLSLWDNDKVTILIYSGE